MTIYIDPFWAGVAVGAMGAAALFIGLIVYIGIKNKGKKGS
jgi:hypothetical protein